jgi:hypothetical protein
MAIGALVVAAVVEPSRQLQQAQFPLVEVLASAYFGHCLQYALRVLEIVEDVLGPDFLLEKIAKIALGMRQDIAVGCCHKTRSTVVGGRLTVRKLLVR